MTAAAPVFIIGSIHIGVISEASCLNIGENSLEQFTSYKKQNQGFGSIHGKGHRFEGLKTLLNDPDEIDMMIPLSWESI